MPRFYIVHINHAGENHQLAGTWEAPSALDAIDLMQRETGDDAAYGGTWEAHEIIPLPPGTAHGLNRETVGDLIYRQHGGGGPNQTKPS